MARLSADAFAAASRAGRLRIIEEAALRGEVQALDGAAPRDGLVPVAVPERLTVSLDSLGVLAVLAGFSDLADAFEAAGADDAPQGPALH